MRPSHITIGFIFTGAILIASMGFIIFGDNGLRDLNAMKRELKALKAENNALQQENIDLHRRIQRLKEDPEFMENTARQELKMISKDEIVFKFTEDDADKHQPSAAFPDIKKDPSHE